MRHAECRLSAPRALPREEPLGYVTRVGKDSFSDAMVAFISDAGLEVTAVRRDPKRTVGLFTIATDPDGERTFA